MIQNHRVHFETSCPFPNQPRIEEGVVESGGGLKKLSQMYELKGASINTSKTGV